MDFERLKQKANYGDGIGKPTKSLVRLQNQVWKMGMNKGGFVEAGIPSQIIPQNQSSEHTTLPPHWTWGPAACTPSAHL